MSTNQSQGLHTSPASSNRRSRAYQRRRHFSGLRNQTPPQKKNKNKKHAYHGRNMLEGLQFLLDWIMARSLGVPISRCLVINRKKPKDSLLESWIWVLGGCLPVVEEGPKRGELYPTFPHHQTFWSTIRDGLNGSTVTTRGDLVQNGFV